MPDAKKVEQAAKIAAAPLNKISAWKYESPWEARASSRDTIAQAKHKSDFDTLQKTAKGTAATLGKVAATIIKDQKIIQTNLDAIKTSYADYEKPFKAQQNTSKIASLLMEVNAVAAYWHAVVVEIGK